MRDRLLKTACIGYLGLVGAYGGLLIHRAIDDSRAVARVEITPRDQYGHVNIFADDEFLAFDRNNDGEIDEIKAYHFTFGPR